MSTWYSSEPKEIPPVTGLAWAIAGPRLLLLASVLLFCLAVLLPVRGVEHLVMRGGRSVSPKVPHFFAGLALRFLGLRLEIAGKPMAQPGAVVANHASWLDIFVLNAADSIMFVSKAEVALWPGIGVLARATGTLFISRDRREAEAQRRVFIDALRARQRLLFFPEGTSTDGQRVLDFKPTLFAAFFEPDLRETLWIQPVTVKYTPPDGEDPRAYGWWGNMEFAPHLLAVAAMRRRGHVSVTFHPPLELSQFSDRKAVAKRAQDLVRSALK